MFYSEFVDDPKMKRLTLEEWGIWIGLLCLAEKSPTFGSLYIGKEIKYELTDICLALNNYDIEKLKVVLNKFLELKMIDYDENNAINITNFRLRQSSDHPKMVYERVKKHRNKVRNEFETEMKRDDNAIDKSRVDKNRIDKSITTEADASEGKTINEFIKLFEPVNPSYEQFFKRIPQRKAMARLLKKFGADKLAKIIEYLPKSNHTQYCPTIISPTQLEEKVASLEACLVKNKLKTDKQTICKI